MKNNSAVNAPVTTKLAWSIAAAISLSASVTNVAYAADAADEEEAARGLEEITVTGSRIRRDDFSNPQPTTVVGGDLLENLGIVNLGDAMANLPSNVGNNTPTANHFAAWFEAFLDGQWYTFDPRNNTPRIGRILIARGRDAADVPISNTFGPNELVGFTVWADEVTDGSELA
jgi:outer membrane receptor protein involved in Fe transport